MDLHAALRGLAQQQHGLVATWQARDLEARRGVRRSHLESGDWEALSARVLRLVGTPPSALQRVMAGVLDAGPAAVASGATAAAVYRLPGFWVRDVEVSRLRGVSSVRPVLARLSEPRYLPAEHTTAMRGIPVSTLPRALFELAAVLHPQRLERALDNAIVRSPAVLPQLHDMLEELSGPGRSGVAVMRGLLAERPRGYVPPATGLEARAIAILQRAGYRLERQVDVGGPTWLGRVDLRLADTPLLLEIDSALFHSSLSDRRRDAERDRRMEAIGLTVVRIPDHLVWNEPRLVIARVEARLSELGLAYGLAAMAANP